MRLGVLRDVFGVGDENDRAAFGVQLFEQSQDFVAAFAVEGAGGFVGENHRRVVDQRAGDGDALLLAAGEFGRTMLGAVAETQPLEQLAGMRSLASAWAGRHTPRESRHSRRPWRWPARL